MARGVHSVSARCSRSVHVVHVVADQEHSDYMVQRYRYRTELVWRFVMLNARVRTVDSTFKELLIVAVKELSETIM